MNKLANILAVFMGLFTIYMVIMTVLWVYPRTPVSFGSLTAKQMTYKAGDDFIGDVVIQNNIETQANYGVRLICEDVLYYTLRDLPNIPTTKMKEPISIPFNFGTIPHQVNDDMDTFGLEAMTCRVESRGSYPLEIAPFVTKTLRYDLVSNNFVVKR